jgi:hypothetical protein
MSRVELLAVTIDSLASHDHACITRAALDAFSPLAALGHKERCQ